MASGYSELAVSFLAVVVVITSSIRTYPWREGQAVLAWVADYSAKIIYPRVVTNLSTYLV